MPCDIITAFSFEPQLGLRRLDSRSNSSLPARKLLDRGPMPIGHKTVCSLGGAMEKASVLELKGEVLKSLWAQTAQRAGTQAQSLVNPHIDSRLAVGYSQKKKNDYQLELRVQRQQGSAYKQALMYKEKAKQEANIEVVPSIEIPSKAAVFDLSGQKGLIVKKEPLHIGVSVGHSDGGAGTLGAFVSDEKGNTCVLSNNHVLALMGQAELDDHIYHPGRPDKPLLRATNQIARLSNYIIIMRNDRNPADAAIAVLDEEVSHESNRIPEGLGFPSAGAMIKEAASLEDLYELLKKNQSVCKIGRTTGHTEGRIGAVALDNITVKTAIGNVVFDNVIEVNWESNRKPFSKPGDSGSMVYTKDGLWAVGLHFAGGEKKVGGKRLGVSYSCNMITILQTLDVSLLD